MSRPWYLLFVLLTTSAFGQGFADTVGSSLESFSTFPRVQQRLAEIRANLTEASGALDDSPAALEMNIGRSLVNSVTDAQVANSGGLHSLRRDALESTLSIRPRNIGILNSLRLDLSYSKTKHEEQLSPGLSSTANPTDSWASRLSYDLVKGGNADPTLIVNRIRKAQLGSSFYTISKLLVSDYLEYRSLLVTLVGNTCKLRNAAKDLEDIERTVREIEIAHRVKSVPYKQLLSVLDTRNFVLRNKIGYELDFEESKRQLAVWDATAGAHAVQAIGADFVCDLDVNRIEEGIKAYAVTPRSEADFEKTLDYFGIASDLSGRQFETAYARSVELPSVRPYAELSQNNQFGFPDRKFELGLSVTWDVPGKKQSTQFQSATLRTQGARLQTLALKSAYVSSQAILANRIEKNRDLLRASWEAYLNSNRLVRVLEVQKSIGQIDSASVSNAYTQRNQIQNALFDSLIRMDNDFARWKAADNWREVLAKAGFKGN